MVKTVVIIPALNPLNSFIDYVKQLNNLDIDQIVVVNDGSDEKYKATFKLLEEINSCIVLEHSQNKGKGRALKTGFQYVLKHFSQAKSVITVGAHNQHKIDDVKLLLHNVQIFSDGIILGVRKFFSKEVPIGNAVSNRAASILFELFFRKRLLDTQTGLRCIPKQHLTWLLKVPGESYSYDTNMLVEAIRRNIPIYEIPVGHMRVKKNSIMYYDEIANAHQLIQQMITTYTKSRRKL